MINIAEELDNLNEYLDREKTRDDLLNKRSKEWQLATNYAFGLATEALEGHSVTVPFATRGLIIASCLAGGAALLAWALFLNLLPATQPYLVLCAALFLGFSLGYQRLLNALGVSAELFAKTWAVVGGLFCFALLLGRPDGIGVYHGVFLIMIMTSLSALGCALAWLKPKFRFRANILEITKRKEFGDTTGDAFLLAMINVVNAVLNLRKAKAHSPEQFEETRKRIGATPGHRAHGSHPLALSDHRFADDLEQLLEGQAPASLKRVSG